MRLRRDVWNLIVRKLPSRRIRRYWLSRMVNQTPSVFFVGMNTFVLAPENISIGDRSVINMDSVLDGRGGSLLIEHDVDIGPFTHVWTLGHSPNDGKHGTKGASVKIKHHAWIASRVTILPGVTIGAGAVIASNSVVTKDVADMTIVAGNPAKVIGMRTNDLSYQLSFNPRFR